uniref:Protein kinase domain-containing protein n=1 Tax=Dicentrarchus labrax TaxID=13489 RepID=A0A8C4HX10_DICLA
MLCSGGQTQLTLSSLSFFRTEELKIYKGSLLAECHKVESFLGEGGFGFVTKCHNLVTDKMEAIKVNKNHPSVFHQARAEIAILKRLQCLDPDTCNIVKWNGYFFDRDHVCLNFELLDQSLYSYMVGRDFRGLSMAELRPILFQLATTLSHLRSMDIVHADLKPDNVMIVDSKKQPLKVKLIDFGLARPVSAVEPGVCVQTTWYRAPEVMLHLPFDEAIDVWSLGLVAAELATGSPLYPGDTEYDVLRFILETQGQPADDVLDRGMGTEYYFRKQRHGQQHWMFKSPEQFAYETGVCANETRCQRLKMLELDPDQRIKPLEVLQHPFFAQSPPQNEQGWFMKTSSNPSGMLRHIYVNSQKFLTVQPRGAWRSTLESAAISGSSGEYVSLFGSTHYG